jgi:hypothetical protein
MFHPERGPDVESHEGLEDHEEESSADYADFRRLLTEN